MEAVKEGVANFRAFQLENREFMGWFRSEQENKDRIDKRRSKIHFSLLGALISLALLILGTLIEILVKYFLVR